MVTDFGTSSGLKPQPLNTPKASTLLVINTKNINELPNFHFTFEGYETLGSAIGSMSFVKSFWSKLYKENIEPEINSLSKFELTLDAKSVLSKSKVLPKISYNSNFYEIPIELRKRIENKMSKFSFEIKAL